MRRERSFKSYIKERFYDELCNAVRSHIKETISDDSELDDINVKSISIEDLPNMEIAFNIIVESDYEVPKNNKYYDELEQKSNWFLIACTGDLSKDLSDFKIHRTEEYYNRGIQENPLSDALVPIIYKENLDEIAEVFLKKYYQETLRQPIKIDPLLLATRMGLTVEQRHITHDLSVFGQVFFSDYKAKFYDKEQSTYKDMSFKAGTILVDPEAYYLRNVGSVNNTIVQSN